MVSLLLELVSLLTVEGMKDPRSHFLCVLTRRYLTAYARGHFDTAAVYGRRIAEVFSWYSLPNGHPKREEGLCEMIWANDFWYMHAVQFVLGYKDLESIAEEFGMPLTTWSIYDDLTQLRWYGNAGAHVDYAQIEGGYSLEADAAAFTSTIRIVIACIGLFRMTPLTVSRLRSKM